MSWNVAAQILFWVVFAAGIGGFVYLMHRLTAPAAKRINEGISERHYARMAARGREVALPRTWLAGGLAGHDWNTDPAFKQTMTRAALAILVAFLIGVWLRADTITAGQVLGEASMLVAILAALYFGVRYDMRRKVRRALDAAGELAPRAAFKVVANAHGLFVPVGGRVIEGAWSDWTVTDVDIEHGKYGVAVCNGITLAHRAEPGQKVPLIASTFEGGAELMEVIAARVAREAKG